MLLYTQGHYVQTWCHKYSTRPLWPSEPRLWHPRCKPVNVHWPAMGIPTCHEQSKAACGLCFHQLGSHVQLPWFIHKTGSTWCITTLPEEDWAVAIGNIHKKLVKIGQVFPEICTQTDICCLTQTYVVLHKRQTDMAITVLHSHIRGRVTV